MLLLWVLLLLLVSPHSITGQRLVFFAQEGGSVTLPKQNWTENENVYVRWYFQPQNEMEVLVIWKPPMYTQNTGNIKWHHRASLTTDSSLVISFVNASDFDGVFRCEQENFRGSSVATYSLVRVLMPNTLLLVAGQDLILKCQAQNVEVPSVKWTTPSCNKYDNKFSGNKNILIVRNISSQHSGVWKCETAEDPSRLKATTDVTVIDLSPSPSDGVYTSSGSPATLPCSLSTPVSWSQAENQGLQGISWSFTLLNQSHKLSLLTLPKPVTAWSAESSNGCLTGQEKNSDLSVQVQGSTDCRGTYECSLEFSSKTLISRRVRLEVLEVLSSPKSSAPGGVKLREGDTVNLTCSLGGQMPSDLQVKWIPPKQSLYSQGHSLHSVHLTLPAVRVKDSGWWKCELLKNSTVLTSASVTLKIEKFVETWVIAAICSALIFILLLVIAAVVIGRRRKAVLFKRRKERFCCCKNPQPKGFYKT
ncbi:CD4-1 molecule [Salminus brasiliensis]|uniref:CD4-1 molecule n=1 Tax=Salminus brasiliensis TaxID=930266 RepID=UPI003B83291D